MSRQPVVHITLGVLREQGLPGSGVPVTFCGVVGPSASAAYCHTAIACKVCLRERRRFHRWLAGVMAPASEGQRPWAA